MVKIMDIRNSSKERGGYLKKVKNNDMVQALRGMQPPCSWDDRTLSRKDRGVKIFSRNPHNAVGGSKLPP
jgi:ribosomal protein L10